jgi:hypothetical protein
VGGAKNSGFISLHLALVGPILDFVRPCFKELYMWSCFAHQFTKMALAPLMELFMELQPKNGFTGEVKPCQRGLILISNKKYMVKEWLHMIVYIGMIRQVFNHVRSKLPTPLCHMSI